MLLNIDEINLSWCDEHGDDLAEDEGVLFEALLDHALDQEELHVSRVMASDRTQARALLDPEFEVADVLPGGSDALEDGDLLPLTVGVL